MGTIGNLKHSAVGFAYLPRQSESDTASAGLGGVEGDKQVRRVGEADPIILNQNDHCLSTGLPGDGHLRL